MKLKFPEEKKEPKRTEEMKETLVKEEINQAKEPQTVEEKKAETIPEEKDLPKERILTTLEEEDLNLIIEETIIVIEIMTEMIEEAITITQEEIGKEKETLREHQDNPTDPEDKEPQNNQEKLMKILLS